MEGQNKHFSHTHNLNLHKIPEPTEITCSGCNSSATATVYACWPCNFFLHEQCFRAARSLAHPSHPSHPLTLLPFPTYPSNSFVCNSCNQVGTGFTYCCSNCEFDLHVQCAYNISISSHLTPTTTHILPQQETLPSFTLQNAYMPHHAVTYQETLPSFTPLSNQEPIFNPQNTYLPHQALTHQHIPNPSPNQQTLPSYNPQYASVLPQGPTNEHIPISPILNYPIVNETGPSFTAPHYSQIPQPSHNPQPTPIIQTYHPVKETEQNFTAPQNFQIPSQNPPINETVQNFNHIQNYPQASYNPHPIPSNPIPSYPSINETLPSLNQPSYNPQPNPSNQMQNYQPIKETVQNFNTQNSQIPSQNPPISETVQNLNHIQNYPQPSHSPQPIPSIQIQNYHPVKEDVEDFNAPQKPPRKETVQNLNHIQNSPQPSQNPQPAPSNPVPPYPSENETLQSLNVPQNSHIPQATSHESINQNVPMPTSTPKADTSTSSNPITRVSQTESPSKPDKLDRVKTREIIHFSHPHELLLVNRKAEEDSTKCSACEEVISGSRYSCSESGCNFHLDKSCFRYSQAIQHKSHPDHPLTLLPYASDQHGQFICSVCFKDGFGFMYHCTTCEYDLHIKCASLPETVKRDDHEHPLKLFYSCPIKGKEYTFCCDDCGGIVQENWWTYYCEECDYGTHLDCGDSDQEEAAIKESRDEETVVKESRDEKSVSSTGNPVVDAQLEMQRLQLQMEMAHQSAQMMASMGQSISNLAG